MNPAIMLVDVASANREGLKSFLQNQKCHVDTAADGVSAVRCCLEMQPDLVLLYDSLPDIGSFELCHQIKKDPLNQLTPVVLLKPSPDLWDIQRGREAGAMDTWPTPPSVWDLLGRIQTLLRLKKYMDEQAKSAVFALARSVDSKQNLRNGHSERLVAYAEQLGEGLGLGDDDLHELRIASWLHDIGKINVPESILLKPGPLNAEERRIMQEHPIIGEKICAPLKSLRRILPVIRHHHEKMDGSGYPDGLRGEAIPLKARRSSPSPRSLADSLYRSQERLARCIRGAEVLPDLHRRRILPCEGKNDAGLLLRVGAHGSSGYLRFLPNFLL